MKRILLTAGFFACSIGLSFAQWIAQPVGFSNPIMVYEMEAVDQNVVWAAGADSVTNAGQGFVRSINGGQTWNTMVTPAFSSPDSYPVVIHFFDPNNGVAFGDPVSGYWEIYTSNNGGTSWTRLPAAAVPTSVAGELGMFAKATIGDHIWVGSSEGRILHSANKGLTWSAALTQVFDIQAITRAAKNIGAFVGWDLAHAAGNIELKLHDWGVDFAAWCSYKYMNSGPGNASGCFVHEKYHGQKDIPRFEGWWGHNKERRFLMEPEFQPEPNANAWQISNAPVLALAPYLASLELFEEVGMQALIEKRNTIVSYLEFVLHEIDKETEGSFEIITPSKQEERGTQLSVFLHGQGKEIFRYLMDNGVITDWREPNVIRLAPAPFYCSFEDMYEFGQILKEGIVGG